MLKIIIFLSSVLFGHTLHALTLPEPLQQWEEWVMYKHPQARCSFQWNKFEAKFCAWPSNLALEVKKEGMYFEQRWQVEADNWLTLPGSQKYWPESVTLGDRPQAVIERDGRPATHVAAGDYLLKGFIPWGQRPESVPITPAAALVTLNMDGKSVAVPNIDAAGNVWLRGDAAVAQSGKGKNLPTRVQVFRKLTDGIPILLETELRLRISGEARELQLGRALPAGFELLAINSPLPARLEADGRLRVQVRQGDWRIKLSARYTLPTDSFTVIRMDNLWPQQEIWVFSSRPDVRAVTVKGVSAIDPQQTSLPEQWRNLPAYLLSTDEQLVLEETARGDTAPAPDRLALERDIWLDFDGAGMIIKDRFTGELNQAQRMQTVDPYELGRADLNGHAQLITTLRKGESGLELPQGTIELQAVSRLDSAQRSFAAAGWNHAVDSLQATLHLPPGWQLFATRGVDQAPTTWVAKWSLFDIFLVLVISSAFLRLFGAGVGLLTFITLLVTFHAPGAPKIIWLNLALTIALLRVITGGRLNVILTMWRNLSALGLLLLALLFAVQQLQQAVYPMLEKHGHVNAEVIYGGGYADGRQAEAKEQYVSDEALSTLASKRVASPSRAVPPRQQYDADAFIQTGPGVPTWVWERAPLRWSGPVVEQQQVRIYLMAPVLTRLSKLLGVVLLALLMAAILRHPSTHIPRWRARGRETSLGGLLLACLLGGSLLPSPPIQAEVPDAGLLQELEQRLLEPPACAPSCAAIPQARIRVIENQLLVELSIDALARVAVPLPAKRDVWLPRQVQINGVVSQALLNDKEGVLHIAVPAGRSRVVLEGELQGDQLRLPLPLAANNVAVVAPGWQIIGLIDGRAPSGSLQLSKIQKSEPRASSAGLLPSPIAAFVEIHRVLRLGVDWYVDTTVSRIAPQDAAINLTVPLIAGEQLLSDTLKQANGAVQVSLRPGQHNTRWRSSLDKTDNIELHAADGNDWAEIWELASDTRWHVEWDGLAPIKQKGNGAQINPRWLPRPGERLRIHIVEPQALPGASQTIEQVRLGARPGLRRTAIELTLRLRAGHAGSYDFSLPDDAQLQKIILDGQEFPLPDDPHKLSLPLHPGMQEWQLHWQSGTALQLRTETPALNLGLPATNINLQMHVPAGRWLLLVGGPSIGPAMLVWGVLLVIVAVSILLGRLKILPLRTWEWLLLGVGMSTVNAYGAVLMVLWFFAMHLRGRLESQLARQQFNGMQFLLGVLTLIAFTSLLASIPLGLLGTPDMQIAGNGSSSAELYWYQDRSAALLPQGWIVSLPLWFYRLVMLLWSLWLAFAMIQWLQWAWQKFSYGALWKPSAKIASNAE